jgi:opacity protein-like surface antigen
MKRGVAVAVLVGACAASAASAGLAAESREDAAQAAAESWLKLVDEANYKASWEQAAKLFKGAVTQAQWEGAAAGARNPLGKLVSRKLKAREYKDQLPGAPDGRYVVIQYDTVFANKASAVETVIPMADPDGAWRVSGYFVR